MTSDIGEGFSALRDAKRALRAALGVNRPECPSNRNPTILLPGQRCKVCKYKDPRPHSTRGERNAIYEAAGLEIKEVP